MPEGESNPRERFERLSDRQKDVLAEIRAQSREGQTQEQDEILRDFFGITYSEFAKDTAAGQLLLDFIDTRTDLETNHAVNLWRVAWSRQVLRISNSGYANYSNKFWPEIFAAVMDDRDRLALLHDDLMYNVLSTTVADRGKPLSLAIQGFQSLGLLPEHPTAVEFGGGGNYIFPMMQLVGQHNLQYSPLQFMDNHNPVRSGERDSAELRRRVSREDHTSGVPDPVYNPELTAIANRLLGRAVQFHQALVVDRKPLHDPIEEEWRRAALRPNENPSRHTQSEVLEKYRDSQENIVFVKGDILELLSKGKASGYDFESDIALFSLSLYQNKRTERAEMLRRASQIARWVLILEHGYVRHGKLRMYRRWRDEWNFSLLAIDREDSQRVRHLARIDTERVNKIYSEQGTVEAGDERLTFAQLIKRAA